MKSGDEESGVGLSLGINSINPLPRSFAEFILRNEGFRMTVRSSAIWLNKK